jgi:hypothetical protein
MRQFARNDSGLLFEAPRAEQNREWPIVERALSAYRFDAR